MDSRRFTREESVDGERGWAECNAAGDRHQTGGQLAGSSKLRHGLVQWSRFFAWDRNARDLDIAGFAVLVYVNSPSPETPEVTETEVIEEAARG